ncbi:penicillin-binding protein 2 [Patescibacteria group bacterium]|nr:penicillin-binding protein 2 [Patescibacteria group bacterium]
MKNHFHPDPFEFQSRKNVIKGSDVERDYGREWEETLVDAGASEPRKIRPLFNMKKLKWLTVVVLVFLGMLLTRLVDLQVVHGEEFQKKSYENRYREHVLRPPRGVIYDSKRNLLVRNVPRFDVAVIPADFPKIGETEKLQQIAQILEAEIEHSQDEFMEQVTRIDYGSYRPVEIRENITREQALILESKQLELPGIEIQKTPIRKYLFGEDFSHILGYIGRISEIEVDEKEKRKEEYLRNDMVGKSGLEISYEDVLRGKYGKQQVEVNSWGKIKKVLATKEPHPGDDIILSIDIDFQKYVREKLQEGAFRAGSKKASAVAIDPQTGDILAFVSIPSFDNNLFTEGISSEDYKKLLEDEDKPLINRPIAGVYPPGSIMKPVVALGALQEGIVNDQTTIVDRGKIEIASKYDPDTIYKFVSWNLSGLGPMNLYSAIAKSSDIYFYYLGGGFEDFEGLGAERLYDYYERFLLGTKTGIDLPSESPGLIPTPEWKQKVKNETWNLGDSYHLAIGQGDLLITPLQAAVFTATVANGGTVYKPRIVKKTYNYQANEIREFQPQVLKDNFVDDYNYDMVQKAMRETILTGSGKSLNTLPVEIAGKTGTAQFANNTKTHAWFTAFAPYDNPEIALVVLVEGGGEGQEVAVPIAGEILKWYFEEKENNNNDEEHHEG